MHTETWFLYLFTRVLRPTSRLRRVEDASQVLATQSVVQGLAALVSSGSLFEI